MGVLAFVIGVASTFLVEFIPISVMNSPNIEETVSSLPIFGLIAFIPSIVGLILGIADVINKDNKSEKKILSKLGVILSSCSLAVILLFTFMILLEYNNAKRFESMIESRIEDYWNEYSGTTYLFDEDELEDDEEDYYDDEDDEIYVENEEGNNVEEETTETSKLVEEPATT